MYAKITKDKLWQEGDSLPSRAGAYITGDPTQAEGPLLKVRLLDDDREHYYTAEADDEALERLYEWAMHDAGVTILQVKGNDGIWRDEIS